MKSWQWAVPCIFVGVWTVKSGFLENIVLNLRGPSLRPQVWDHVLSSSHSILFHRARGQSLLSDTDTLIAHSTQFFRCSTQTLRQGECRVWKVLRQNQADGQTVPLV